MKSNLLILESSSGIPAKWRDALAPDFELQCIARPGDLLQVIEESAPTALLLRVEMTDFPHRLESVKRILSLDNELPVILELADDLSADQRCRLLATGIMDHVEASSSGQELRAILGRATRQGRKLLERRYLRDLFLEEVGLELQTLVPSMEAEIREAAGTEQGVLIFGEPGSGRGSVARIIHQMSGRAQGAFVRFNPSELSSDECRHQLFGLDGSEGSHRRGLLELADSGTLLVEEIDRMPQEVQDELGSAMDGSQMRRVGGLRSQPVHVRLLGTAQPVDSNGPEGMRQSKGLLDRGALRLVIPPLKERKIDFARLVKRYVDHYSLRCGRGRFELDTEAEALIRQQPWTGGLPEIQRAAELAVLRAKDKILTPKEFWANGLEVESLPLNYKQAKKHAEIYFKRGFFDRILRLSRGKVTEAANLCDLPRPSLSTMLKDVGIQASQYKQKSRAKAVGH